MRTCSLLLVSLLLAFPPAAAQAQTFPTKTIEIVVPFAPGGSTDTAARMIGQRMAETFGQAVIVNNRPGGGSIIGTAAVAKAAPDGHTLLAQTIAFAINAAARKSLPYDPINDFSPIVELSTLPLVLLVHPSLPVNSLAELVALAKAKPGTLNYASSGNGTSPHLAAEMFKSAAGLDMVHIPYKGNAEATNALLGGHVGVHFGLVPPFIQYVRSGALRALAVTTEKRIAALPETPTIAELGYPGYEISSWQGLFAPAGTPRETISMLNAEVVRIMNLPEMRERLRAEGAELVAGSSAQFTARVASEIAKWRRVIALSGAKME
ncbi:MAG: tripartite tricarboxylate transporter substrate binding protein [Variibacter sp.]|nr:tripartite tricarboxylate transporter substrate binding protein [Variibacter sp.]